MKRLIIASTFALAFACAGSVSAAQNENQSSNQQNFAVNVTATPGQYETYVIDLHAGYGLAALVGNTHRQFMQAQRAADHSEALRKMGLAQQANVAVAIDNSTGPGVAKRIVVTGSDERTVAVVDVVCKRAALAEGGHCQLFTDRAGTLLSSTAPTHSQHLASAKTHRQHLALAKTHSQHLASAKRLHRGQATAQPTV